MHIALLVTGYKIRHRDIVGTEDRLMPKPKMASREATGFLTVILEVSLNILVGIITDDLAGVFIGTHCAI